MFKRQKFSFFIRIGAIIIALIFILGIILNSIEAF